MIDKVNNNNKINIKYNTEIISVEGDEYLKKIIVKNNLNDITNEIDCGGLFIAIVHHPNTNLIKNIVELTENRYIKKCNTMTTMTTTKGIFASGDIIDDTYRQVITACGSSCMAALDCIKFLEE